MKKGKTASITLIIILTILVILITGLMIFLIKEENNYLNYTKENKIIYKKSYNFSTIEKIDIKSTSSDIEVKTSENDEIKIIIYGKNKEEATSKIENNILNINKNTKRDICFGWCFGEEDKIILYLPKQIKSKLEIKNQSGDIWLEEFEKLDLIINNKSGDIKIDRINNLDIASISGDISIQKVFTTKIKSTSGEIAITNILSQANLETNSGDINITNFKIKANSNINSKSGDIFISNIEDAYISPHTSSGDVRIKESNRYSKYTLDIHTISGDITVR